MKLLVTKPAQLTAAHPAAFTQELTLIRATILARRTVVQPAAVTQPSTVAKPLASNDSWRAQEVPEQPVVPAPPNSNPEVPTPTPSTVPPPDRSPDPESAPPPKANRLGEFFMAMFKKQRRPI